MDIVSYAKNIGIILAAASTVAYVSGYLSLRARAFALGTDPGFTLVDEAYVFAGFRLVFLLLIILLLLSPFIFALRSLVSWLYGHTPDSLMNSGQWLLLVLLGVGTLFLTIKVLSVNGVLLQNEITQADSILREAIMGGTWAVVLMSTVVLLAALTAQWLKLRFSIPNDPFVWVLSVVFAIQILLLPIFNGVLYADRQVRVLGAIPSIVQGIKSPLGIVDRTSEHVTLLGLDNDNQRRLVTIKLDELNGIPVKAIIRLKDFIETELVNAVAKRGSGMTEQGQPEPEPSVASTETKDDKGVFDVLIDYLQFTFEAIGSLSGSTLEHGQIWSVEIDATGSPSNATQLGKESQFSWPVFGPKGESVYAIHKGQIVQLTKNSTSFKIINNKNQWTKLFGVAEDGAVLGLIYEDDKSKLALLQAEGKVTLSSTTPSDEQDMRDNLLKQESRSYSGSRSLYVERSTRGGRGFDVYFKTGEQVFNLSDCADDRCGQASLSVDFRRALFIRKSRY